MQTNENPPVSVSSTTAPTTEPTALRMVRVISLLNCWGVVRAFNHSSSSHTCTSTGHSTACIEAGDAAEILSVAAIYSVAQCCCETQGAVRSNTTSFEQLPPHQRHVLQQLADWVHTKACTQNVSQSPSQQSTGRAC